MATAEDVVKTGRWANTQDRFVPRGGYTQVASGTSILGAEVPTTAGFTEGPLHLKREIDRLKADIEDLKAKVAAMQARNSPEKVLEIREIPREQAKEEIRAFFKAHHGEAIYPSEVMEALSLDYDLVYEICEELEKEGVVKGI